MASAPDNRSDVRGLILAGVVVVALVLLGGAALLRFAAQAVDRVQVREERQLVQRTLDQVAKQLEGDVTTATVWDQAYKELRPGGDVAWADAEIGTYFAHNRGHDRTFVYDPDGRPFYAFAGQRIAPTDLAQFQKDVRPVLTALRQAESVQAAPTAVSAPTAPDLAVRVHGLVRSDGALYFVVASTVTPEVWNAPRRPGPAVAVISAQRMDRKFIPFLGDELRLRHAVLGPASESPASLALEGLSGEPIGAVTWEPERPGLAVLRKALPGLVAGFLTLVLAAALLASRVRTIIHRLNAKEGRLSAAVTDLVHARDEAQNASRAKSEFLANMSHEIRTPLNGVLGMAQVMARHDLEAEQAKRLQVIRNQGELLLNILNAVLDISKIESGKLELEAHPFDLEEAVRSACDAFATQALMKDLSFEIQIDEEAKGVWNGDEVRVRQVLTNLVSNAVKFTAHGGVRVRVRTVADGLHFQVSDTGIGIAPDKLPQLFEKFTQADTSTTRRFGGTGLGLAICRELVGLMGGRMDVTSRPGEGSTFAFNLPLGARIAAKRDPAEPSPAEAVAEAARTLRVLAAEDNPTNQLILHALLEPFDMEITIVENGVLALEACKAQRFDLILMDAQMPEMNGPEAAQAIRRLEADRGLPRTPILALTANVMSHQLATYAEAGMDGFVAKPIDAGKLYEAIARATAPAVEPDRAVG